MRWVLGWLMAGVVSLAAELPITGIAEVGFRVSSLNEAASFYIYVLGLSDISDPGSQQRRFYVSESQSVVVEAGLAPGQDVRLGHISIATSDAGRLRTLLQQRGLQPGTLERSRAGLRSFWLSDPEGHQLQFVEQSRSGNPRVLSESLPLSVHLLHTGVTVSNLDRAMEFYRDKLGFVEIWRGGRSDSELNWINLRMPGPRGDYIELMLHAGTPTREQYGSMHHICLEVPDIQQAYKTVLSRGVSGERHKPRIGRNKRWQLNLFDPDGSRTELMEPKPAPESSQP